MFAQENISRGRWVVLCVLSALVALSHEECGEPPRLDFAILGNEFIGQTKFPVDAIVTYSCSPGYVRVLGTKNSTVCLSSSTWSTPDNFCTKRSCGHPGRIDFGDFHADDFLFGSKVTYTCDIGYKMVSKFDYRICQADGTWSNSPPICEAIICQPPDAITDGSYEPQKDEYNYQEAVTYKCRTNLALIGASDIHCTANGTWSANVPKCIAVECQNPSVPNSIRLSGFNGPYNYQSAITFECNEGFKMNGSSVVKCNASSQWDPSLPICYRETTTTTPSKETTKGETTTTTPSKETTKDPNGSAEAIAGRLIVTLTTFIMGLLLRNL